jgi:hypothetical protein
MLLEKRIICCPAQTNVPDQSSWIVKFQMPPASACAACFALVWFEYFRLCASIAHELSPALFWG